MPPAPWMGASIYMTFDDLNLAPAIVQAVREQKVCRFTAEESDVLVRPGPRMAQAARLMAACIERMAK